MSSLFPLPNIPSMTKWMIPVTTNQQQSVFSSAVVVLCLPVDGAHDLVISSAEGIYLCPFSSHIPINSSTNMNTNAQPPKNTASVCSKGSNGGW